MKALSLFSGIGGIDLACEWADIETVAFCEREPFPQKVLRKHWPNVPIYDDVCTLTKERLEADGIGTIDIIHGGYPCQPFSTAGNRKGTEDDRHLWPEVFRLIQAIKPRWFVGENVAGHITLGLDIVLADLDSIGYAWETFVIPACAVNAPHRRDRVFIVGYPKHYGSSIAEIRRILDQTGDNIKERAETPSEFKRTSGQSDNGIMGIGKPGRQGELQEDVAYSNGKPRLETSPAVSAIGSQGGSWNHASWSGGGYITGIDWWAVEPDVGRVANGIPNRVERLKALGNAVVPQQIYPILAAIKQIDDMMQ